MAARRVLVLGATGGTGRLVVDRAAAMGLQVTALARSADTLDTRGRAVQIVNGDIRTKTTAVLEAYAGQDAVISTLGVGQSFKSGGLLAQSAPLIIAAMLAHHVRRLVFVSAFGIGPTWKDTPLLPRIFIKTLLRDVYADKAIAELMIRTSTLDWTIVYPTGLTNKPPTENVRIGERLKLAGFPTVSRADVAEVLLRQLDDATYVRKGILVAN